MITRFQLLRNIGQFDSVAATTDTGLARLTLVYAENGRGKTTLAAILRSLGIGDPLPIVERKRLGAAQDPHVVLEFDGRPPTVVFQAGAWNRPAGNIAVFDDVFVAENVHSGLQVEPAHRQQLHDLIIGAQGVALNNQLQELIHRNEEHNTALREKGTAIPERVRGGLTVDQFCAQQNRAKVDEEIQQTERTLAAAQARQAVRATHGFDVLTVPEFDLADIERTLQLDLPALEQQAAARVAAHLATMPGRGEQWVATGMQWVPDIIAGAPCPFCAQDLATSPVIGHYRAYFSEAYQQLKRNVQSKLEELELGHGGTAQASFERAVRIVGERRQFWAQFCDVPEIMLDTEAITLSWSVAREQVLERLNAKRAAPLERLTISEAVRRAIAAYSAIRGTVAALDRSLQEANQRIRLVKEQSEAGDPTALASNLSKLRAVKARYSPDIAPLCDAYLSAQSEKAATEERRVQVREQLNAHRVAAFPAYETAINLYLVRFNAGFRLGGMRHADTRGSPVCNYNLVIRTTPVAVAGGEAPPGQPSFANTLSAGDRNTLALAFFFASLDCDPGLAEKIVVLDDPNSSHDDHRTLTTVHEIRALAERTRQVIVLSHGKPFLCEIWSGADSLERQALELVRDGEGSAIQPWDVNQDSLTEHDRRYTLLRAHLEGNQGNSREVAESIRPFLEAVLRVTYSDRFPPGCLIGNFLNHCRHESAAGREIMSAESIRILGEILEYANRFHHDTNPNWRTTVINDTALLGFVEQTLKFARR